MAILENETKNYFKVDLAHSFVQKNMVFASITVYGSEADRQIEKSRLGAFETFDANCKNMLQSLSVDEQNAELYASFSGAVGYINDRRYTKGGLSLPDMTISQEVMHLLLQCEYQSDWISRPICIVSTKLVNCGMHSGEDFTSEYIYNKLKSKMALNIGNV